MTDQLALLDAPNVVRLPAIQIRGTLVVSFTVPGEIVPWARARLGRHFVPYTAPRQRDYQAVVKDYAMQAMDGRQSLDEPVRLEVVATYAWPKSMSRRKREECRGFKISKPDIDNVCLKAVADCLNKIVWIDDSRIAQAILTKRYGDMPSLDVRVVSLT